MTREEFDKLYLNKVVHCDTEEKANEFLALADWETSEEKTCYRITKDGMFYAYTSHYGQHDYQIIEYQLQPKFKVGDKVRVKDTIYTTINGKVGVIVNSHTLITGFHIVKVDDTLWLLSGTKLEKVEEPITREEYQKLTNNKSQIEVALKRNKPMKLKTKRVKVSIDDYRIDDYCPTCDEELYTTCNYCPHCGQKLDWSDDK